MRTLSESVDAGVEVGVGSIVKTGGHLCILAQVEAKKVAAICLRTGNRYFEPVEVKAIYNLSALELRQICGDLLHEAWLVAPSLDTWVKSKSQAFQSHFEEVSCG